MWPGGPGCARATHESTGKRRSCKARRGDAALRTALVEAASAATRTRGTYAGAQYSNLAVAEAATAKVRGSSPSPCRHPDGDHLARATQRAPYVDLCANYFTRRTDAQAGFSWTIITSTARSFSWMSRSSP
ncbi:transposase [Geodermatophilus sp. SYSU D00742]